MSALWASVCLVWSDGVRHHAVISPIGAIDSGLQSGSVPLMLWGHVFMLALARCGSRTVAQCGHNVSALSPGTAARVNSAGTEGAERGLARCFYSGLSPSRLGAAGKWLDSFIQLLMWPLSEVCKEKRWTRQRLQHMAPFCFDLDRRLGCSGMTRRSSAAWIPLSPAAVARF